MMVFILMAISFALLPIPLNYTALWFSDIGTWKFVVNLITHQLAHGGLGHLLGNYMFMIPYAVFLESRIGRSGFVAFYLICGFLAAFSQILGAHSFAMVGSSGAAFGVFAGACALFDRNLAERVVAFLLLGLAVMVQFWLATNDYISTTAYWAHFGGALGGLALVHFFVKPYLLSQASQSQSKSCLKTTSRSS